MGRKLALIIGNSQYDDKSLSRLTAPDADVEALADVLRAPDICRFDEVIPLRNQGCATVRRAIAHFYDARKRDDLLLLYFSGHGVKDENGYLYLALRDTESSLLAGTAIEASFITGRMDRSFSKRQVLILDCCHSGAFAAGTKSVRGGSVGTATAFQGTGRVVLTATDATQYAWEGDRILGDAQTSLFTRFLIEGLRTGAADQDDDGEITVDELYEYVYEKVVDATPTQTPGKWAWLNGKIVLVDNTAAKRVADAMQRCASARDAIDRTEFTLALELLRRAAELDPASRDVVDLVRRASEGIAAEESAARRREAERIRLEQARLEEIRLEETRLDEMRRAEDTVQRSRDTTSRARRYGFASAGAVAIVASVLTSALYNLTTTTRTSPPQKAGTTLVQQPPATSPLFAPIPARVLPVRPLALPAVAPRTNIARAIEPEPTPAAPVAIPPKPAVIPPSPAAVARTLPETKGTATEVAAPPPAPTRDPSSIHDAPPKSETAALPIGPSTPVAPPPIPAPSPAAPAPSPRPPTDAASVIQV